MEALKIIINIVVFCLLIGVLFYQQKHRISFNRRVLTALVLGLIAGAVMQLVYGPTSDTTKNTLTWLNIVGQGYVRLLQMIVIPLVFVSITSAIVNLKSAKTLHKYGLSIITILLATAAIAAIIGIFTTVAFKLDANSINIGTSEESRMEFMETRSQEINSSTIAGRIVEVIPSNAFAAFAGTGSNATLSVVVFAIFVGVAALIAKEKDVRQVNTFVGIINSIQTIVMGIVEIIIRLTPYGILALMTRFLATSKFSEIKSLGVFVIASYVALILIFISHLIIVGVFGLSPVKFVKKCATVFAFAFTSRSSAASLPITIKTQEKKLGVPSGIASLSSTFGTSIGQNGCAGMYPAMLAVMIAVGMGINPLSPIFIIELVLIIVISSFGVAGVGGGATFAALIVLSAMNLPVALAGVLISIEPLIDMGRTLTNVSGSILSGVVTAKRSGELDLEVYNSEDKAEDFTS